MKIFLVGGNGFIGSALARELKLRSYDFEIVTRSNFGEYIGRSCDLLINANGNSRKYLADESPLDDFDQSVRSVVETLSLISSKKYVFLSSGDVYPKRLQSVGCDENANFKSEELSAYGFHKYLAEKCVERHHWLIFRLSGFVGEPQKKCGF